MAHPVRCRCGSVQGTLEDARRAFRVVCYCKDCQAFAYFLSREKDVLDERGGSDIVQVLPKNVTFTQGADRIACMRLTPQGLLRWHASCCNTPIGNTMATPKVSFIGLLHSCLDNSGEPLDAVLGPIKGWVHVAGARGGPKPKQTGQGPMILRLVGLLLKARFNGDWKRTPLFRAETGARTCEIYLPALQRPRDVDDEGTLTLGHELLHCMLGDYHR